MFSGLRRMSSLLFSSAASVIHDVSVVSLLTSFDFFSDAYFLQIITSHDGETFCCFFFNVYVCVCVSKPKSGFLVWTAM